MSSPYGEPTGGALQALTAVLPIFMLLGWLFGRSAYFSVLGSGVSSDVFETHLDLLNLAPAYAAGRIGLRGALVDAFFPS